MFTHHGQESAENDYHHNNRNAHSNHDVIVVLFLAGARAALIDVIVTYDTKAFWIYAYSLTDDVKVSALLLYLDT